MRGAPDDSNIVVGTGVHRLDDMAELAARLGSPVQYHRYGDVVFMDTFIGGANCWVTGGLPALTTVGLANVYCKADGVSLAAVMFPAVNSEAWMYHAEPPPLTNYVGIAFGFYLSPGAGGVHIELDVTTDEHYVEYDVFFEAATGILYYYDAGGLPQAFATPGSLEIATQLLHQFKLVIDYESNTYRCCYLNNLSYDMTTYIPKVGPRVALPHIRFTLRGKGDNLVNTVFAVDNVVITQNEL